MDRQPVTKQLTDEDRAWLEAQLEPPVEQPSRERSIEIYNFAERLVGSARPGERGRRRADDGGFLPLIGEGDPEVGADPFEILARAEEPVPPAVLFVRRLLRQLPQNEAEVLRLRYGIGGPALTQQETAERMGLCRKTIYTIERRAEARLRGELGLDQRAAA